MLASASRNSWKKLHFSALPSDLNLVQLISYSISTWEGSAWWEAAAPLPGDTAGSQGMVATSRASVPWAGAAGKVSIHWDPAMAWTEFSHCLCHPELTLPLMLYLQKLKELCLSPSGVLDAGELLAEHWGHSPQVTGPVCQSLLHSWEFPFQLSLFHGSVVPWICLVAHSTAQILGFFSSPALLPAARALSVISQNICSVSRQKERGCLCLLSKNNLCNLVQVLKGRWCWVPCWCVWSSPVSS